MSALSIQNTGRPSDQVVWIDPPEINGKESVDFPDQETSVRMTSVFCSMANKESGLRRARLNRGNEDWLEVDSTESRLSRGRLTLENGFQYMGFLWDGHLHGRGKMTYPDGTWIEGFFDHEKGFLLNSPIKMSGQEGEVFSGFVSSVTDSLHRTGTLMYPNKDWIKGVFKGNLSIGFAEGVITLETGRFDGSLFNGKPHGQGRIIYSDGSQITGQFNHETGLKLTERVQIKQSNGDIFDGFITSIEEMRGGGKLVFANGNWSKGTFNGSAPIGLTEGALTLEKKFLLNSRLEMGLQGKEVFEEIVSSVTDSLNRRGTLLYSNRDWITGTFNGNISIGFAKGVITLETGWFEGSLFNGKPHGQGTITYEDGSQLKGQFDHETGLKLTERVQIKQSNGDIFDGLITSIEEMQGVGEFTFANGDWVKGPFNGNTFVGLAGGVLTLENGGQFKGNLLNGKPHGQGSITYRDGSQIHAEFDHETGLNLTVPVRIEHSNGDVFKGFITSIEEMQGKGSLVFANGDWIKGVFDGNAHIGEGRGRLTLADGIEFEGTVQNGRVHGYGTVIFDKKISDQRGVNTIEGRFDSDEGRFDSDIRLITTQNVTIKYSNGTRFKGKISEDWMPAQGIMYFPTKDWVRGEFREGKPIGIGKGRVTYADGSQFKGILVDGRPYDELEEVFSNSESSGAADSSGNSAEEQNEIHFFEDEFRSGSLSPNFEEDDLFMFDTSPWFPNSPSFE